MYLDLLTVLSSELIKRTILDESPFSPNARMTPSVLWCDPPIIKTGLAMKFFPTILVCKISVFF